MKEQVEEFEKSQSGWKGEKEELMKQKNKLVSEKEKLKNHNEEVTKKLDILQNKANKETSTEKRLLFLLHTFEPIVQYHEFTSSRR